MEECLINLFDLDENFHLCAPLCVCDSRGKNPLPICAEAEEIEILCEVK